MLRRAKLVGIAILGILLAESTADAQQPRVPRIGFLSSSSAASPTLEAFRQGLRDLGYLEGQSIAIESRWADGRYERLPDLATELVRLNVDVILAANTAAALAAKRATTTIPIVVGAAGADPVKDGLVASLARPGGNVTGLSLLARELNGKRLQLLKEAIPGLSRVAVLWNPNNVTSAPSLKDTEAAARSLALRLQPLEVRGPNELDGAFQAATMGRARALLAVPDPMFLVHRTRIADLALKTRLPMMAAETGFAHAGGLMVYGPNIPDNFRRAATFVDKILKGAKPADLPVEQPMRFELVINMKTAKALGLTFPQSILIRADQVIQ